MKVLIIHNILWAHYKAAVFQSLDALARQQPNLHIHVVQIARNERSRAGWETSANDAPIYQYDYELLFDRFVEDVSLRERTLALLNCMKAYRPDVLYLTGYYDPAQLALLAYARLRGVPVVMQMESTAADNSRGGLKETLKRSILRLCSGFFCFGSLQADYLRQLGVPARKILLQKTAVDNHALLTAYTSALPHRTKRQEKVGLCPRNFVFVGRLIDPKNLPALLVAFAGALQQTGNAEWGLVLLGDGPLKTQLDRQTRELALSDRVLFMPAVHWYRVPDTLALCDVLVLPSRSEPWGLVVNEAMVCGLPVVVSDRCGCVKDLVRDGQNGFVFNPESNGQLTDRLVRLIQMTDHERLAMGQTSQEIITSWSVDAVAKEMLAGFQLLTKQ